MAKSKSRPTIYTIAEEVGVSPAAVSLALSNQPGRVSAETAERIRQAAQRLGYVPNLLGRRLRAQEGLRQIDLAIVTSFEAPLALVGEWVRHLHDATRAWAEKQSAHVSIAIELFHAGKLEEMRPLLLSGRFNGLLITNTHPADDAFLEGTDFPMPLVVIGRHLQRHPCVTEPYGAVGREAAEIFHACGVARPAFMHGLNLTELGHNRMEAFVRSCEELWGRPPELIRCEGLSSEIGEATMDARIRAGGLPDGLFAVTDSLLLGAYRALHKTGVAIPGDISVLGIGDYETTHFYNPALSTLADTYAAVKTAIPRLLELMQAEEINRENTLILPKPIFRGSLRNESKIGLLFK